MTNPPTPTKRRLARRFAATFAGLAVILWAVYLAPTIFGGGTSYIRVTGNSMEPTYEDGDLVVQRRQDTYEVGDVVAFRVDDGVVIHRIIAGDGERGFTMQGDNNDWVDQWTPTDDDILGTTWKHVPGGGVLLDLPLQPAAAASAAGAVALFGGLDRRPSRSRAAARRRRAHAQSTTDLPTETQMIDLTEVAHEPLTTGDATPPHRSSAVRRSASVVPAVACAGLAGLLLLVAAVGWTRPTTAPTTTDRPVLTETTTFDYTATMTPSTLYPDGQASAEDLASDGGGSLYTNLAQAIDVRYTHRLAGPAVAGDVTGTVEVTLTVRAAGGWSQTRPIAAEQPFTGTAVEGAATVNVPDVVDLVSTVEAETGFRAGTYAVLVTTNIDLEGLEGVDGGRHSSSPALELAYDGTRLAVPETLVQTDTTSVATTARTTERFGLLGLQLPVVALRAALLPALVLLGVALLLGEHLRRSGHAQLALLRARHGSRIVTVGSVERLADAAVQVTSFNDLVRIVERTDGVILDLTLADEGHAFVVQDGASTYEYRVPARASVR